MIVYKEVDKMKRNYIPAISFIAFLLLGTSFAYAGDAPMDQLRGLDLEHHLFSKGELVFIIRIGVALLFGCFAGFSHDIKNKLTNSVGNIGLKTYGAVSLGAASFSTIATHIYVVTGMGNALQNIGAITTGIGFLCAAVIFKEGVTVRGLSTAATIWATAGIGTACGAGLFGLALAITFFIVGFHLIPNKNSQVE